MTVPRYSVQIIQADLAEVPDGKWVKADDYADLERERNGLKIRVRQLEAENQKLEAIIRHDGKTALLSEITKAVCSAVAAEREACAETAERWPDGGRVYANYTELIGEKIRARDESFVCKFDCTRELRKKIRF